MPHTLPIFLDRILAGFILVLKHTSIQFFALVGVLFISGFVFTLLSKWTGNVFRQFRFPKLGLYVFGAVGIPLHELCHALFAKLFLHDIESIKWFDPRGRGGSYGTVVHYYNDRNIYQRIGLFFIGLGPVLLAPIILFLGYRFLVPGAMGRMPAGASLADFSGALGLAKSLLATQNWHSIGFYVFLYLALCLTSQMELSPDDFKIARDGVLPILLLLFIVNLAAVLFRINLHARLSEGFQVFLTLWSGYFVVGLVIALINLFVSFLLLNFLNRVFGKPGINPFQNP